MNTKTVNAAKTYNPHPYFYDKIGLEDSFPKSVDDIECIKQLHERIDAMAKAVYPHLFEEKQEKTFINALQSKWMQATSGAAQQVSPHEPDINEILPTLEDSIKTCKHIKALTIYEPIIEKEKDQERKQKLWDIYDEVFNKLQNQL